MGLPVWGMVGCNQILTQMDAKIAAAVVLGIKVSAPRKVDNKPLDLIRAVSESFLELDGVGAEGSRQRACKSSRGTGQSVPLQGTGPADFWELFWFLFYAHWEAETRSDLWFGKITLAAMCALTCTCAHVYILVHTPPTPNSPESCPVWFSHVQRNPEGAGALAALRGGCWWPGSRPPAEPCGELLQGWGRLVCRMSQGLSLDAQRKGPPPGLTSFLAVPRPGG